MTDLHPAAVTVRHHVITVVYWYPSIRLHCSCHWKADLGDTPTLERLMDVAYDHRRGAKDLGH